MSEKPLSHDLIRVIEKLNVLYHEMRNEVNKTLLPMALSLSKLRVLKVIQDTPQCYASSIMDCLNFTSRSVTEALDYLLLAGFITREKESGNRKVKIVRLTTAGEIILAKAMSERDRKLNELLSCMNNSDLEMFQDVINRMFISYKSMKGS
ncbi:MULTISPECIES: MarR family winged helix-turn-helix transcriptional regulator [Enterobacter]|uniref:MarR family winged helix-turn-helix transcriptional regulator n=1 Tax=Enterobacter TaxID=547 RepID=UPI000482EFB2|nr:MULTISPECIES: MarR family transcriptional regulator [Enterobacter cloacae complex]HDT2076117.1 MarR family transcriptional regulator [Enterobacter roggenkampii]HEG2002926.1 MarR family transcriptional regulator [Enterobacter asburiae]MCD2458004.1 MarR family transcriptional regulator [Enterobacter cloacae complex sp. 2021EL-01261]MDT9874626.1 MarR family transcriptional regulator [Enterobacter cloacae]HDT2095177.1 MarR family transcriptional regulator [Enterobacter roggenkampii]